MKFGEGDRTRTGSAIVNSQVLCYWATPPPIAGEEREQSSPVPSRTGRILGLTGG